MVTHLTSDLEVMRSIPIKNYLDLEQKILFIQSKRVKELLPELGADLQVSALSSRIEIWNSKIKFTNTQSQVDLVTIGVRTRIAGLDIYIFQESSKAQ